MTQFVHYVGHAEHFTSKQKTDALNNICNEMAADNCQIVNVISDLGDDGSTVGLWLFFAPSSSDVSRRVILREPILHG